MVMSIRKKDDSAESLNKLVADLQKFIKIQQIKLREQEQKYSRLMHEHQTLKHTYNSLLSSVKTNQRSNY